MLRSIWVFAQIFEINKFITGISERLRCFLLSDAHDIDSGLVKFDRERCVIAVAGNDDKSIVDPAVQKIESVDHESHVGGVFARNVVKLLFGLDREAFQFILPVLKGTFAPVAVRTLHDDTTVGRDFLYDRFQLGQLSIVGIYEHCYIFKIFHSILSP